MNQNGLLCLYMQGVSKNTEPIQNRSRHREVA